jgi:hypothetical protein
MIELLTCEICGFKCKSLITHLKYKHNISTNEYKNVYGQDCKLYLHSEELKQKISNTLKLKNENPEFRKLNSQRQKNGASCLTINYWKKRGYNEIEAMKKISEIQIRNSKKAIEKRDFNNSSILKIGYWVKKGNTEHEAREIIKQHQIRASKKSSKFLGHRQTENSKRRISGAMKRKIEELGKEKWINHFGEFDGTSKIEIECFNYIKHNIDAEVKSNIIVLPYIVDIIKDKKIIEFYGDYWHCNPVIYNENDFARIDENVKLSAKDIWIKDKIRIDFLKKIGYNVLIIWERDWNSNRKECIEKIKEHLI